MNGLDLTKITQHVDMNHMAISSFNDNMKMITQMLLQNMQSLANADPNSAAINSMVSRSAIEELMLCNHEQLEAVADYLHKKIVLQADETAIRSIRQRGEVDIVTDLRSGLSPLFNAKSPYRGDS